jgi:hypothetical protein
MVFVVMFWPFTETTLTANKSCRTTGGLKEAKDGVKTKHVS